ncbi:phosphatase PAP2 family protein [Serratia rubidaea]|nr:phosphatase PAP2 family protein [Serratia rubidaea]QPT14999.1 phosphatase PAP2 family protein [Serratia rubidaea]
MAPEKPSQSLLNQPSTAQHFKNGSIYSLAPSFYRWQVFSLIVSGLLFLWLSRDESLDWAISNSWFDSASGHFPWQHNAWLDAINHRLLKIGVIAASGLALLWGIYRRHARLILCMALVGVGPLVVGILKSTSAHSCPWDLVQYGGQAMSYPLFGALPANPGPGRCFPGGHASSGFAVMALFFLFYPRRPKVAYACWGAGIALGLLMGFGQVMRGAHFFSHNLWAGWWVWFSQLAVYWWVSGIVRRKTR